MIRTEKAPYPTAAITHPGISGKNNEDRFAVSAYRLSAKDTTPVLLAVLSDGIGGHRAGEVAAEIAVESFSQRIAESQPEQVPQEVLQQAVVEASEEIRRMAEADSSRKGMGATCAAALLIGRRLYTITVGDSRIYLIRNHGIRQMSIDHTWIQEALEAGLLQPDEVAGHPNAHIIRRYLGSPTPPQGDVRLRITGRENDSQAEGNQGIELLPGDRLLLCSDGLTDVVQDAEIMAALNEYPLETAVQVLVDLANQRGGPDNITIVVVQVPEKLAAVPAPVPWRRMAFGCLGLLIAAGLFLFVAAGLGWLTGATDETATPTSLPAVNASGTPLFQPLPGTITVAPTLEPLPTRAATSTPRFSPPVIGGATLTPWPTNTPAPPVLVSPTGIGF